jgi:hypothetical protein
MLKIPIYAQNHKLCSKSQFMLKIIIYATYETHEFFEVLCGVSIVDREIPKLLVMQHEVNNYHPIK